MEEELLKKIQGLIADSQKGTVKAEDLDAKVAAINKEIAEKLDNAGMKALKENVDKLVAATADNAAAIKAMNEVAGKKEAEKPMTFKDALIAAVEDKAKSMPDLLADKNDDYGQRKSLKDFFDKRGGKNTGAMTVKIAVDMLESNTNGNYVNNMRLTELDPKYVGIPLTLFPHVTDWIPSKSITRPYMSILVVYSYFDGSGVKVEGQASGQSSFLLKTVEFKSFFIATYFTLSDETLDDLPEAMEEIALVAPSKILTKIDGYILGTAGDDSTAIAGLLTANKKTDFASSTTYATSVKGANVVDVVAAMKLQAETNGYEPNVVVMSPAAIVGLSGAKDQIDNSINDRRTVYSLYGQPAMVCGLRIITSTALAADAMVVLDTNQLMIGKRKDMTMEVGFNGTDLTEGQKTVVIKIRLAFGVRDAAGVIYASSVAGAISDLNIV